MNNNKTKTAWLKVLLCLPAVLIVYFAFTLSGNGIDPTKVTAVELATPDKAAVSYTDRETVDFFVNMYMESEKISKPLRDITNEKPMTVKIKQKNEDTVLSLYPEVNSNGCFFTDDAGAYYVLPSATAKSLLQRKDCSYVYRDAGFSLPSMTFISDSGETVVPPSSYEWSYDDIGGNECFDKETPTATKPIQLAYSSGTSFEMKYSTMPATQTMSFSYTDKDGNRQTAHKFEELLFESDTMLSAEINVTWTENSKGNGGKATYIFDLLYDVRPEVICLTDSVTAGDVLVLQFKHLSETESLKLDSTLYKGELRPVYNGDSAWLLLPISPDIKESGICSLNFTMGNYAHPSISISVTASSVGFDIADMDTALYTEYVTSGGDAQYAELIKGLVANSTAPTTAPSGNYTKPVAGEVLYDYSTQLNINGIVSSVRDSGIDYAVEEGIPVTAAEHGVIVYAQADKYYGNMVIIDHGYGVLSHYYNLGELNESTVVGASVTNGTVIAKTGVSGMTFLKDNQPVCMMHFAVSVNGVFVNPNPFFQSGFPVK